jgi:hypothetical protein
VFSLTGIVSQSVFESCGLNLNNSPILSRIPNFSSQTAPFISITPVPVGFAARPGDVIEIGGAGCIAFGYLSDARP